MRSMKRFLYAISGLFMFVSLLSCQGKTEKKMTPAQHHPMVVMKTSQGTIKVELYADKAPVTVSNFLTYVNEKFYDGTIFHRVIPGFMIQGGGFAADMKEKQTHSPIINEAGNGLKNEEGTLAMARTGVVNSATAQFFINVKDNAFLNHRDESPQGYGYAVFGKVTEGMDLVRKIEHVNTQTVGMFESVPVKPVVIESLRVEKQ